MNKLLVLLAVASLITLGLAVNDHAEGSMAKSGFPTYDLKMLIGKEVKNPGGENLGVLNDFVIDSQGRVIFAILYDRAKLEYGGEHVEGKYVAVPFEDLSISRAEGHGTAVVLDVEKKMLDYAPGFHRAELSNPVWDAGIYRYFGEQPYWTEQDTPTNIR